MRLHDRAMRRVAMFSLGLVGAVLATPAAALSLFIRAAPYTEQMPDGTTVTMWGYRVGTNAGNANGPVRSPGDAITVPADDSTLTVTLINDLPVPTSFVLHGHNTTMTPVFATAKGAACTPPVPGAIAPDMKALQAFRDCRVRSFTHEAEPGKAATYTYTNVRPGTYMYQSGTMPQIQVQMGLYGMVRKNAPATSAEANNAYIGVPFDNQISVLLSEVDEKLHSAVDCVAGSPGCPFTGSTLAYDPKYFRLHTYPAPEGNCGTNVGQCIAPAELFTERSVPPAQKEVMIDSGRRQLVRVVNAGIQSRALELIDGHWFLMAEDGNKFPYPREQYATLLPAAKTADFWFTPTIGTESEGLDRQLTIFDRRMALTNNDNDPSGGQLLRIAISPGGSVPSVNVTRCATTGTQGVAYSCTVTAGNAQSPLYSLDQAPTGMTIDPATGAIAWTPNNAQAWKPLVGQTASNPVQVRVTSRAGTNNGRYATASFSVVVTNTNDAPVAANDGQSVRGGAATILIASLLANDSDPDGQPLSGFTITTAPVIGALANNGNGTLTYTAGTIPSSGAEQRTFTYRVSDGSLPSNDATVTLTVFANSAPVAVDDIVSRAFAAVTPSIIDVLANDFDVDSNMNVATLTIVGPPNRGGTATPVTCPGLARPCISYLPPVNFRGTEALTYTVSDTAGATSAAATVRVNVE